MKTSYNGAANLWCIVLSAALALSYDIAIAHGQNFQSGNPINRLVSEKVDRPLQPAPPTDSSKTEDPLETFSVARGGAAILLPVRLGEETHLFMLNTGSTVHVYDTSLRNQLGDAIESETVGVVGGTVEMEFYQPPKAHIGKLELPHDELVACYDLQPLRERTDAEIRGILGTPFLENYILQIDFDLGRVLVFSKSTMPSSDWGIAIPLSYSRFEGPQVEAQLPDANSLPFLIGTGVNHTGTLNGHSLQEFVNHDQFKLIDNTTSHTIAGESTSRCGKLDRFALGSFTHDDLIFHEGPSNILGRAYLARYQITVDIPHGRLYLRQGKHYGDPDSRDASGITLVQRNGQIVVDEVDTGSPADVAGIRANDTIVSVDGQMAAELSLHDIRKILCGADQQEVLIHIRRGVTDKTVLCKLGKDLPSED